VADRRHDDDDDDRHPILEIDAKEPEIAGQPVFPHGRILKSHGDSPTTGMPSTEVIAVEVDGGHAALMARRKKAPALSPGPSPDDGETAFRRRLCRRAKGSGQRSGLNDTYLSREDSTKGSGQAAAPPHAGFHDWSCFASPIAMTFDGADVWGDLPRRFSVSPKASGVYRQN
jgi:hypothetical protein